MLDVWQSVFLRTGRTRLKHGHELEFPSAFRQSRRDSTPKGIVKLVSTKEPRT